MNIFLAGDSLVQDYTEEEFIAGWGQYLKTYFDSDTNVYNYGKGGRSTRLFINEGRLEVIDAQIQAGDYLLIEFCHNDDASKEYKTMFNRLTELGEPDAEGRFPLIPGERMPKEYIPDTYLQKLYADEKITDKEAVLNGVRKMFADYPGQKYYPYSPHAEKGSYKWFLKQFIDVAREHGAIPVLVTAPARTVFDTTGHIKDGAGLHGGNDFCYIRAMRQLAQETHTPLLDLFAASVALFEKVGEDKVHFLTSIKSGCNKGSWPTDFDKEIKKKETVSEDTHVNKYGAYLLTKAMISLICENNNKELEALKAHMIPEEEVFVEQAPQGLAGVC